MLELLIYCGIGAFFIILGIILLTGRGSFFLAGYNTLPNDIKGIYNAKALCKFMGKIMLIIGILAPFAGIESVPDWYTGVWTAITVVLAFFAIVYANTGKRFRNKL